MRSKAGLPYDACLVRTGAGAGAGGAGGDGGGGDEPEDAGGGGGVECGAPAANALCELKVGLAVEGLEVWGGRWG